MNVKEKITKLRKEREWSIMKLANESGLTPSTVYNWYNERNNEPSKKAIEDICAAFGISMSEFFSDIELDKLTDKETKLLEIFKKLDDKKQNSLIEVAKALLE